MKKYEKVVLAVIGNIGLTIAWFFLAFSMPVVPGSQLGITIKEYMFYTLPHFAILLALTNTVFLMIVRDKEYFWTCFTMVLIIHHLIVWCIISFMTASFEPGIPDHPITFKMLGGVFLFVYMIDVPVILALFGLAWLVIKRAQKRKPKDS